MDTIELLVLAQHEAPQLPDQMDATDPVTGVATEGAGGGVPSAGGGRQQAEPAFPPMLVILLVMGVFFIFMMGGQRKEKKKRAKLLASITKGDKVQTVGGMLGTVVEIRDTEIVLKVDENANTRIKFSRSAIQSVVSERPEKPVVSDRPEKP